VDLSDSLVNQADMIESAMNNDAPSYPTAGFGGGDEFSGNSFDSASDFPTDFA
jgi:hypothetical protein